MLTKELVIPFPPSNSYIIQPDDSDLHSVDYPTPGENDSASAGSSR